MEGDSTQEEHLGWAVLQRVVQRAATVADLDVLLWVVLQLLALELAVAVSMLAVVEPVVLPYLLVESTQVVRSQGWASEVSMRA